MKLSNGDLLVIYALTKFVSTKESYPGSNLLVFYKADSRPFKYLINYNHKIKEKTNYLCLKNLKFFKFCCLQSKISVKN
jgi:hypothetical protein